MLKDLTVGELNVRLKKGTVLPIDGKEVQHNDVHNWSGDTHVLDTVDYVGFIYRLIDKEGNELDIDAMKYVGDATANIVAFKSNNEVIIKDNKGNLIEGFRLAAGNPNNIISIYGADERHSEENNYEGSPLDLFVTPDILTKYFEII